MNNQELENKVHSAAEHILSKENYISSIGLLLQLGILKKEDYEEWRKGKIPYLEKVCHVNLNKLSTIMAELRHIARERNLKPSETAYKKWGKGVKIDLQFSKSGNPNIERAYRTHYVKTNNANGQREGFERG